MVRQSSHPADTVSTTDGTNLWARNQTQDDQLYATRGGSFLCHESIKRYRIAARNGNSGMSAANNLGFRCVKDLDQ